MSALRVLGDPRQWFGGIHCISIFQGLVLMLYICHLDQPGLGGDRSALCDAIQACAPQFRAATRLQHGDIDANLLNQQCFVYEGRSRNSMSLIEEECH
jgi:hypothetical protein